MVRTALVRLGLAIRIVYGFCLTVGTYNHAVALIHHGLDWNYGGMPIGTIVFWTSLTLLDPFVAVLLFLKPKPAAIMLVILMVSDAGHNTWVIHKHGGEGWMVINQWIFLTFVLLTVGFVWRGTPKSDKSHLPNAGAKSQTFRARSRQN
jgi:hypothetical protein